MPKFNLNWMFSIIALMLLFLVFTGDKGLNTKEISYSEFQQYVQKGYISEVIGYDDNSVEAYVKPQHVGNIFGQDSTRVGHNPQILTEAPSRENLGEFLQKECPVCHEWINVKAMRCVHCGTWLNKFARADFEKATGQVQQPQTSNAASDDSETGTARIVMYIELILLGIIAGIAYDWSWWMYVLVGLAALVVVILLRLLLVKAFGLPNWVWFIFIVAIVVLLIFFMVPLTSWLYHLLF